MTEAQINNVFDYRTLRLLVLIASANVSWSLPNIYRGVFMRGYWQLYSRVILVCIALVASAVVHADGELDKASAALTGILFEFSAEEFTSYSIKEDGWVDITFASNTPDA